MFCAKCQNDLADCTCPDIEERLAEIADSPYIIYRACLKCRNHYARCRCEKPEWGTSEQLRTEKPMDQDAIRKLMQADLKAAGLDSKKYLSERKREKTYVYPKQWYCKECLKEYRYRGALYNHIYKVHEPKDSKGRPSWRETYKKAGSIISDSKRVKRVTHKYQVTYKGITTGEL